jgi:small subunit ribosomal protein S20
MRRVDEAIASGDVEAAETTALAAQKAIGVAGRKGVLHKNTVARRQARVARAVNKARAAQ